MPQTTKSANGKTVKNCLFISVCSQILKTFSEPHSFANTIYIITHGSFENIHMQKCKIPPIGNLTSLLLNHRLSRILLSLTVLGIHLIFIGCKLNLSIGIQEQITFYQICAKIVQHYVLSLLVCYLFLWLLCCQIYWLLEKGMLCYLLP